jgi:protein-L-isoaspartate O-methyltransferase
MDAVKYELYREVVLTRAIPAKSLEPGDVGTVVEIHEVRDGETGYTIEFFNAIGTTIAVVTVPESWIEMLNEHEVFSVRSLAV